MRHRNGLRKLNRTSEHRAAMLRNMCVSLLQHEAIKTTVPKAKELRRVVEPLITLAKVPSLANHRLAFNRLRDRDVVMKLNAEANKGTKSPEFVKRMTDLGYIIMGTSPETMAEMNKAEVQRWGPIVKASGAKAD